MRLLTVGNMYPPQHLGGYELIWESAVAHLRRAGHDVLVLTTDFRRPGAPPGDDRQVRRDLRWYWRDHAWPRFGWRARLALERHNSEVFERNLREFRPHCVAWTAMGGMSLSLLERAHRGGLPAMAMVCDEWMLYAPERDAWMAGFGRPLHPPRAAAEWIAGIPTRVDLGAAAGPSVFMSEILRRRAAARWRLPQTRVAYLGADRTVFGQAPPRRQWSGRLLYVGRIDRRKGIDLAIAALARIAGATLRVVGGGDEDHLGELRDLAASEGVSARIEFGEATREELAGEYAAADALLFPTLWLEPWGLVPLEAMAVGTPVVATGRGGSGEYLQDGENCLLFDPDAGAEALAGAVMRLAADPALRGRLREGGLRTAEALDDHSFYEAVEETATAAAAGKA